MRYMIIDDEPVAHRIIQGYCRALPGMELVNQSYDAFQAMAFLRENQVDLMFLDLNMPTLQGFEFLRTLTNRPEVIVTTAYAEFALEGFELNVVDYLVKPFRLERFLAAVNKVVLKKGAPEPQIQQDKPKALFIKGDKKHHRVDPDTILFVEACGNYCYVVTETQRIMTHQTLAHFQNTLDASDFKRVHKSYVIATNQITAISPGSIDIGEHNIPIGQTYKSVVQGLMDTR